MKEERRAKSNNKESLYYTLNELQSSVSYQLPQEVGEKSVHKSTVIVKKSVAVPLKLIQEMVVVVVLFE